MVYAQTGNRITDMCIYFLSFLSVFIDHWRGTVRELISVFSISIICVKTTNPPYLTSCYSILVIKYEMCKKQFSRLKFFWPKMLSRPKFFSDFKFIWTQNLSWTHKHFMDPKCFLTQIFMLRRSNEAYRTRNVGLSEGR